MYQGPHTNFNKEDNDGTCKSYNELMFHGHTTGMGLNSEISTYNETSLSVTFARIAC